MILGRIHQNECPRSGKAVWVKLGENCYHVSRLRMNWGEAKRYCLGQGGYLAEIMSREEEELLDTYLVAGISYWLGLNDLKKQGKVKFCYRPTKVLTIVLICICRSLHMGT